MNAGNRTKVRQAGLRLSEAELANRKRSRSRMCLANTRSTTGYPRKIDKRTIKMTWSFHIALLDYRESQRKVVHKGFYSDSGLYK